MMNGRKEKWRKAWYVNDFFKPIYIYTITPYTRNNIRKT